MDPVCERRIDCGGVHPYPKGLVIATKAGLLRTGPNKWIPLGQPDYLRQECEMSLRRLKVDRKSEAVLEYCTKENMRFIPWFPLATGGLAKAGSKLAHVADKLHATSAQVALAWLLKKSPVMLPIPGTSNVKHLEENMAGALLELDDATERELDKLAA